MTSDPQPFRSLIRRRDPVNLGEKDCWLFAGAANLTLPSRELTTLTNVEVFPRGLLRHGGEYLPISFAAPWQLQEWKRRRSHWRLAAERLLQRTEPFDSPALWITDTWSCGYYHWFGDALPRLEAFLDDLPVNELTLLLPYKFCRADYFLDSLKPFGLKEVRILRRFESLRCRELNIPSHVAPTGNFDEVVMRSMRHRFVLTCAEPSVTDSPSRIYISRRLAPSRRVVNDDELSPVLEKHGENNCYFNLASAMQLHYYYLLADRQKPDAVVHATNLIVDPEKFDESLSAMLRMVPSSPPAKIASELSSSLSSSPNDRQVA